MTMILNPYRFSSGGGGSIDPGPSWSLMDSWVHSIDGDATEFEVINLDECDDILVIGSSVTLASSGTIAIHCSSDNGSTYYSTNEYWDIVSNGTQTTYANAGGGGTSLATARTFFAEFGACKVASDIYGAGQQKPLFGNGGQDLFVGAGSRIDAVRVLASQLMNGGAIYVYGRR